MAPLGALLAGGLIQWQGMALTFKVIAGSSFALFVLSLLSRPLWGVAPSEGSASLPE